MLSTGFEIQAHAFPAISREQLRVYAEASGDFNPIHLDEAVAKKMGLPGIIAHGMYIASLISERALEFVRSQPPLQEFEMVQFQTRFKAMTLLGDIPTVSGSIKEITNDVLVLDLQAKNQRGELTTAGLARFRRVS